MPNINSQSPKNYSQRPKIHYLSKKLTFTGSKSTLSGLKSNPKIDIKKLPGIKNRLLDAELSLPEAEN